MEKDLQRGMYVNWSTVFNYKKIEKKTKSLLNGEWVNKLCPNHILEYPENFVKIGL